MVEKNSSKKDQAPSNLGKPPEDVTIPHIVTGRPPLNIEWCWVPAGPFTMGSYQYDNEKPIRTVNLSGYWLARYPVTNGQFRYFVDTGYEFPGWWREGGWEWRQIDNISQPRFWTESKWNNKQQPVVGVSWYEADAFARWAAEATGEPITLPTEAQWEKAARGADGRIYPWGNDRPTNALCNFDMDIGKTTLVGMYSPAGDGPYGNADMAGNVWEWVDSWADESLDDDVLRGGAYHVDQWGVRSSCRLINDPLETHDNIGFRLAALPYNRPANSTK